MTQLETKWQHVREFWIDLALSTNPDGKLSMFEARNFPPTVQEISEGGIIHVIRMEDYAELQERVKFLEEALESIASKHRPRHDKEEYWIGVGIEATAAVAATDTKIARNALAALPEQENS